MLLLHRMTNFRFRISASPRETFCFVAVLLTLATSALAHPGVPGAPQKRPVALANATIHPVSGPVIEKGTLVFDSGKITAIGNGITPPAGAEVIDLTGKHVYPGLFDAVTDLGLVEINSIRATIDGQEQGQLNPNVRAIVAVNPDSEVIPVTRSNGVLLTLAAPYGGLMSGRSGVIQLEGWTWEEMTIKSDVGLHIQWPSYLSGGRRGRSEAEETSTPRGSQAVEQLRQALADARAYGAARKVDPSTPRDARWESLQDVLDGKLPVMIHADEVKQITAAVAFAEREKLRLVIVGGYDAPQCIDLLKKHNVPVIVGGTYRLPRRRGDAYDAAYSLPAELHKANLKFCISTHGRFGASNVRNLPYHAEVAVGFGLPADEALKAITLFPAQILGVDDRVGSLAIGKDATLFVADGDPLNTATQIVSAWIGGRKVDLNDRHKTLFHKYEEKYKQQRESGTATGNQ
jgi:imidazolonepropionase-like amidohydrolase